MKRRLTVGGVAAIIAAVKGSDVEFLEKALQAPGADQDGLRRQFELRQAAISIFEGAAPDRQDPLQAAEIVAQVSLEILGYALRATHDGDPPCAACFMQATNSVLKVIGTAAGLKAEQMPPAVPHDVVKH